MVNTDLEAFNRPSDIELVHSVDNNGRSGEEEQKEEEQDIKQDTSKPPARATHWQVLPAETQRRLTTAEY